MAEIRISNYNDLVEALRTRKAELGLSDAELEERTFLAAGHVNKMLGPSRCKGIGASTLEPLMDALAVDFVMVPNPEKLARSGPIQKRRDGQVHNPRVGKTAIRRVMRELAWCGTI